jgi:GDP-L-fucose synthase
MDLVTIANKINCISSKPSEIIIKNEGLNTEYSADNTRLLKELKSFTFTPFDEALKCLYSWYKNNLDKIDKQAVEKDNYLRYCRTKVKE